MTHAFINIASALPRDMEQKAISALDVLGNPLKKPYSEIIRDIGRIHFFSITVVPSDEKYPPYLVFEISADGDKEGLLKTLAEKMGPALEPVFKMAENYGASKDLAEFWKNHIVKTGFGYFDTPGVAHTGTPGMTVKRIHKEAELAKTVSVIFKDTPRNGSALEILERVRALLRKKPEHEWAFTPEPAPLLQGQKPGSIISTALAQWPGFAFTFLWPFALIAFIISAAITFPGAEGMLMPLLKAIVMTLITAAVLSLAFIVYVYAQLRQHEESDTPDDSDPNHELVSAIMQRENHAYQNHLAGVSIMKEGMVRQITIRLIFWLIGALAGKLYRPGFLGSIGTIHFARWFMLPGTNRLLFFSNYGGSWESYLEDFITKANFGLTGVWSNTLGFPKTTNLVFKGASDGDRFKRWARRQQNPTWCWYSAYHDLTTARIRTNAAIRQGIAGISTETEASDWLTLFSSSPLPRTELASSNIQGILFGGFGPLPHATLLTLQLPDDVAGARKWLADIEGRITFGDYKPGTEQALILTLSASGLRKLGLDAKEIATFPSAFVSGMTERARILGDRGESAPEKWTWGGRHTINAALMLYAPTKAELEEAVKRETAAVEKNAGKIVKEIQLQTLPPKGTPFREPFGFVDGVSQPVIRGIGRHKPGTNPLQILEPGEFILGYPDGLGTYPQTPHVPALNDPANDLYATPGAWKEQRPDFSESMATQARDLGKDGSYIVIRQLEQDVDGFNAYLKKAVGQLASGPCPINVSEEWVGAKMVGRWKDGSSLVRNPYAPASADDSAARPDNNFLFGKEDPQGMRCPFGSHIRRTNPRESFEPNSMEQLAISNRHRILRAGRLYEEEGKKGLLFVCVNADIERQFEFIQQTWVQASTFHGLDSETDPFINDMGDSSRYTIPMTDGARTITGLKSFVTTRGGEYFFLPGRRTVSFLSRPR